MRFLRVGITTENDGKKEKKTILARLLEISDNIVALLGLLEPIEGHFGAGDVFLGVLEVVEKGLVGPDDTLVLVSVCVREPGRLAGLATDQPVQVGTDLVGTTLEE